MRRYPVLALAAFVALGTAFLWAASVGSGASIPAVRLASLQAPDLGIAWSSRVAFAQPLREAALGRLLLVLTVFSGVAAAVAFIAVAFRMRGLALEQRRGMAIRGAVGGHGRLLTRPLLKRAIAPLSIAAAVGSLAGASGLTLAYLTWPGRIDSVPLLWIAVFALASLLVGSFTAVRFALRPARFAVSDLSDLLRAGDRATASRYEGSARRLVIGAQLGMTLALLGGSAGVLWSMRRDSRSPKVAEMNAGLMVVPVVAQGVDRDWSDLLDHLESIPSIRPESIASIGGWVGLGTQDFALAHCGACWRGGLPIEMLGQIVHHHAVSPGFFRDAGQRLVAGRDFGPADAVGSEPVAIVSAAFARGNFEKGDAVGRELRIGASDRWYRVVGIVDDPSVPGLGRDATPAYTVYVALSQHPPDRGEVAFRSSGTIDAAALSNALERSGFRALGPPRTAALYRDESAAPLRWWGRWMGLIAALCLIVAVQSAYALARAEATARRREMAIRVSLGSSRARIVFGMLGRAEVLLAIAAFWATPFATAVSAAVGQVALGVSVAPAPLYLALLGLLAVATALGTLGPALHVAHVSPGEVLGGA